MSLGNSLFKARKKSGLSQEEVGEKLGVTRQTISKWETDETIPDIFQTKKMSKLYNITLDDLIEYNPDVKEIEEIIEKTDEKVNEKINWTNAWGKKYPILLKYQNEVEIDEYVQVINKNLDDLKKKYNYSELDAMLVFKDILYRTWKNRKNK